MGNLLVLVPKEIQPKGLNKDNKVNRNRLQKYILSEEFENLSLLKEIKKTQLKTNTPTLFYPGCGYDILFPLLYIEELFPKTCEFHFIFNDLDNNLPMIKTILDDLNVSFSERNGAIMFYWDNLFIHLRFVTGNIFEIINNLPNFDLYFERSFRIMKSRHNGYEDIVYNKLKKNGVLISDTGFDNVKLKKIKIPKELSFYREMIMGLKKSH